MPKILRIINRLNLGGPTYNVSYLSHYLKPKYETLLVSGAIDDSEASSEFILKPFGIVPQYIPEMQREINFNNDRAAYQKIKQLIKEFKPDIVHTHAAKSGALGRLAAHNMGVKNIVHTFHGHVFHSYFSYFKTQFYLQTERYLASKSHAIVAISDIQKQELLHKYNICKESKMHVVPLGFNLDRFQQDLESKRSAFRNEYLISSNELAVVIVGRLVPVKNHVLLLNAFKEIEHSLQKIVRFFIVGDGELKQDLIQHCKQTNISYTEFYNNPIVAKITFTSWILDIDRVFAGADLVMLTSLNEGTPVSIIEAQAAGLPIISTKVGGVENIVTTESAKLITSNNMQELAKTMLMVLNNKEMLDNMKNKAVKAMFDKYSYQTLCNNMDSLYTNLLNK